MTDEEKYKDIAENNCRYYGGEYDSFKECFISAKDAADWKEQQMIEKLSQAFCNQCDNIGCQMSECTRLRSLKDAMKE